MYEYQRSTPRALVGCFFTGSYAFSCRARHNLRALSLRLIRSHYDAFVSALAARFTHADSVELVQPERGADEAEQNPDERQYAGSPV